MTQQRHVVLVTGGRGFFDKKRVFEVLDAHHEVYPITLLVHGNATGADMLSAFWAQEREVPAKAYPAQWNRYGQRAGMLRNAEMLKEEPNLVVAFPGGKGTEGMKMLARNAGVEVVEYMSNKQEQEKR